MTSRPRHPLRVVESRRITLVAATPELVAADLAERIDRFANDRKALDRMADQARKLGRPEAARLIVDDCYTLLLET